QLEEELSMPLAAYALLARSGEPFEGVLTEGLQHHKARVAAGGFPPNQAVRDQRLESTGDVRVPARDGLRRFQRKATHEHAEGSKEDLLGCIEQLVAPANRVAHRLLPGWQVSRSADQ